MTVKLLDAAVWVVGDIYRGQFFTSRFQRVHCGHRVAQPGKDKAGRPRRDRHCYNDATYMRWTNEGGFTDPLCTQHYKQREKS